MVEGAEMSDDVKKGEAAKIGLRRFWFQKPLGVQNQCANEGRGTRDENYWLNEENDAVNALSKASPKYSSLLFL